MNLENWKLAVDQLMKTEFCIDTIDAGLDAEQLNKYWNQMPDPFEFVDWFGSKYDLTSASVYLPSKKFSR